MSHPHKTQRIVIVVSQKRTRPEILTIVKTFTLRAIQPAADTPDRFSLKNFLELFRCFVDPPCCPLDQAVIIPIMTMLL
jgi:hypothetical protein